MKDSQKLTQPEYPLGIQLLILTILIAMGIFIVYYFVLRIWLAHIITLLIIVLTVWYCVLSIRGKKPILPVEFIEYVQKLSEKEAKANRDFLERLAHGDFNKSMDLFFIEQRHRKPRKPISNGLLKRLMVRSRGNCENCGKYLKDIKFDVHHKNYDPTDNRESNLMVICKACHVKITGPAPLRKSDRDL